MNSKNQVQHAGIRFALSTQPLNITESACRVHAQIMYLGEIRDEVTDEVRERFIHIYGVSPALLLKHYLSIKNTKINKTISRSKNTMFQGADFETRYLTGELTDEEIGQA